MQVVDGDEHQEPHQELPSFVSTSGQQLGSS
jgi:hypothetical protein